MTLEPLLLGFLEGLLRGIGIKHAAAVGILATVVLYGRHLMTAGRMAQNWLRVAMFASAIVLAALLLGIIPGIDIGRAIELGQGAVQVIMDVIQI